MKRTTMRSLAALLALCLMLSLTACGQKAAETAPAADAQAQTQTETASGTDTAPAPTPAPAVPGIHLQCQRIRLPMKEQMRLKR